MEQHIHVPISCQSLKIIFCGELHDMTGIPRRKGVLFEKVPVTIAGKYLKDEE